MWIHRWILSSFILAATLSECKFSNPLDASSLSSPAAHGVVSAKLQFIKNNRSIGRQRIKNLKRRLKSKMCRLQPRDKLSGSLFSETLQNTRQQNLRNMDSASCMLGSIENKLTYYMLNISVGTPEKQFMVQVDTGSSDLWIPGRSLHHRGYDPSQSRSFTNLSEAFHIQYAKDSATGYWGTELVRLGNSQYNAITLQMAIVTSAPDPSMGILGIGPIESETSSNLYLNLPHMLAKQKLISKPIYSMYMDKIDSVGGQILFGGIDKAKYKRLTTLPFACDSTISVKTDAIFMNKVQFNQKPIDVLLDTGTSFTYLPEYIVNAIAREFSASYDSDIGLYVIHEHELKKFREGISFRFNDIIVNMPIAELFWPLSWFSLEPSSYLAMSILTSKDSLYVNILGDSFLRNAYVIYDLEKSEVHIGQYFPSTKSNIVPI